jgi:hypothetical protein
MCMHHFGGAQEGGLKLARLLLSLSQTRARDTGRSNQGWDHPNPASGSRPGPLGYPQRKEKRHARTP